MTEQIKAWAVVDKSGKILRLADNELHVYRDDYSVIELTSTPKIKMTQAEWDEFNDLKDFALTNYGETTPFTALDDLYDDFDSDYPNLRGWVFSISKITSSKHQIEFAQLWASDNPEELVEIEKETRYWLVSKLDKDVFVSKVGNDLILVREPIVTVVFSQPEIDKRGGDDFLNEMGLKKVEVTE